MPRPRLFVTRKLPPDVEARLDRDYEATLNPVDGLPTRETILEGADGKDALLVTVTDRIDAGLIGALPDSVKIIATFSVGYDHIDLVAAKARGVTVANTPDVLTDATAEIAMLLMLGAARQATSAIATLRSGQWKNWAPTGMLGMELTGKRLGILGLGRIGRATAKRARAFGMEVHYHNRRRLVAEMEEGATYHPDVESLFRISDVLSLHCASTPETRRIVNRDTIRLLPEKAIVVNTARGDIVDDEALIEALASGRLAAAGLDVFANEPNLHPAYLGLPNAFLLPHLGSATRETRNAMGFRALDNLDDFFAGRPPRDALNT
ncbi:MAG: D-glycerate dehydrogenase [Parvibaculum sp.]|nr:D-glycerate dehydrogenase [Parvibaculum sp.]